MISKFESLKRSVPHFGLALFAMLALGAFSAGAAQATEWTIDGKPLSSLGGQEEVWGEGGPFELEFPVFYSGDGVMIVCEEEEHEGNILAGGTGDVTVQFSGCEMPGMTEVCQVEPIQAELETELTEVGDIVYQVFTPTPYWEEEDILFLVELVGEECVMNGHWEYSGSFAAELEAEAGGPEAVEQPLSFSRAISEAAGASMKLGRTFPYFDASFTDGESVQLLGGEMPWGVE